LLKHVGTKDPVGNYYESQGEAQVEHNLTIPSPDSFEILIRIRAVVLNPSDWIALDTFARPGAGAGYYFAGEVVEIGQNVEGRVARFVHGCESDDLLLVGMSNLSLGHAQFWANSTTADGVYGLTWNPDGETPIGEFPVVVKASES